MTAEVAILNKGAVVLAADSAVTISAGSDQHKTYDSADKLFELSSRNHIAIMVNGDLDFVEVPLSVLIKKFRTECDSQETVDSLSDEFLKFLSDFGRKAPDTVLTDEVRFSVRQWLAEIEDRASKRLQERVRDSDFYDGCDTIEKMRSKVSDVRREIYRSQIAVVQNYVSRFPDASFVGIKQLQLRSKDVREVEREVDAILSSLDEELRDSAIEVGKSILRKAGFGASNTGLIIAGFGNKELFPTLISISIYGMVGGRLKYFVQEKVDVDRSGPRARVVAFAQREMVDRFLYGIDADVQAKISKFSQGAISSIREAIFDLIDLDGDGLSDLESAAKVAEDAFLTGLSSHGFAAIRTESEAEIEEMVEFMPKAEMARMAEALVNLTSIKRRVTKGMETVGGPIDVAVVSHSEGLVWVKRKHYFPAELNSRFFARNSGEIRRFEGGRNGDE